jgi:hypothetical protein
MYALSERWVQRGLVGTEMEFEGPMVGRYDGDRVAQHDAPDGWAMAGRARLVAPHILARHTCAPSHSV